jgi:CHAT domain
MFELNYPLSSPIQQKFSIFVKILGELSGDIEIVVRSETCELEGSNTRIIKREFNRKEERFILTPSTPGQQKIRIDVYQNNINIYQIIKDITITSEVIYEPKISDQISVIPLEIEIDKENSTFVPSYLELYVQRDRQKPLTFHLSLTAINIPGLDYFHQQVGSIKLNPSIQKRIYSIYQRLSRLAQISRKCVPDNPIENLDRVEDRISAIGRDLWNQLIPKDLQEEYWNFRSLIKFILITSDEPWIPWEIVKPYTFDGDGVEIKEQFWCQQFAMSRWLAGFQPASELPTGLTISVSPQNTNLKNVKLEVEFIQQLNKFCSSINCLPPIHTIKEIGECLNNSTFCILHFACHGMFDLISPNNSVIKLSDGDLDPLEICRRFEHIRPIIFINACNSGRINFSITKISGWAAKFIEARVGVFIGTMWEVSDELALEFAKNFYTLLLRDNLPIAEAFQKSREIIRRSLPNNSTWLAYVLYAYPYAQTKQNIQSLSC